MGWGGIPTYPMSLPGEEGAGKASLASGLPSKSLTQPCPLHCSRCCSECCCPACCCLPPGSPASTSCPCCADWPAAWAPRTCERLCWAVCCSSSARDTAQMLGRSPEQPAQRGGRGWPRKNEATSAGTSRNEMLSFGVRQSWHHHRLWSAQWALDMVPH